MALLTLLALSFALQPVLAAIGETHELAHAGAMQADGHVVDGHDLNRHDRHGHGAGADDGDHPGSANDDDEGDSPWHAALHFAHCCGLAPTVLTPATLAVPMSFATSIVPEAVPELPLADPIYEPQRPPIL